MRKTSKMVVLTLILMMIISMSACAKKAGEKIAESIMENAIEAEGMDADVDVDGDEVTIQTEDGEITINQDDKWPDNAPDNVPEFKKGSLVTTMNMGGQVTLVYDVDDESVVQDYVATVKSTGFETTNETEMDGVIFYMAQKDGVQLTVTYQDEQMGIMWYLPE